MGYALELGYIHEGNFAITQVEPFTGGTNVPAMAPEIDRSTFNLLADISDQLDGVDGDDSDAELPTQFGDVRSRDEDGLVNATIDVTTNYSRRIREVADIHLSELDGQVAAEAAPVLMQLVSGLGDETAPHDYWKPVDGNIKHLASTLLDWTFQHPDATFRHIP